MDAHRLFLDHLELIERIVRTIGRRHHLSSVDHEDFGSLVNLRLLEDDCAVLRKFRGRSSMWTYLVAVIERQVLDFLSERWGKWRPTAAADTMGPAAVLLERLVIRDGHTLGEAIEIARTNHSVGMTYAELHTLWTQLPPRTKPVGAGDDAGEEAAETLVSTDTADAAVEEADFRRNIELLERTLDQALADLATRDRVILALRFNRGMSVIEIAKLLQSTVPTVHRRIDHSLKELRAALAKAGFLPAEVSALIGHSSIVVSPLLHGKIESFLTSVRLSKRDG